MLYSVGDSVEFIHDGFVRSGKVIGGGDGYYSIETSNTLYCVNINEVIRKI